MPARFSVERLALGDVLLVRPTRFADARGHFMETYSLFGLREVGIGVSFLQDNESLSVARGTVRGLHFQVPPQAQAKLVRVVAGAAFDVVVDLRAGSPTYGRWCGATLTAAGAEQIFVPAGFAHGYCTLEPNTIVAYKVDRYYAPECDRGIRWDDPDLGIAWPVAASDVVLSEKDANLPPFRGFTSPFATSGASRP